ncbi:MAG TPA: GntR family transcriptional regulator [Candidatus Pelethocola excrementipullorum]|nr:GntR family transcriptional regulator [Candidatus Pelethocola excrementipullorum]
MNSYIDNISPNDDLYLTIRNYIISMELEPGEMFSENTIAAKLNVGRVTVREAITRLHDEGYIEVFPQKGTVVTMLDVERIKQAAYAHTVLEQAVIKEIMERGITESELELLRDVLEEQQKVMEHSDMLHVMLKEYQIMYHISAFCGRQYIWEFFNSMDCDLLRIQYLQHSTFNYQMQTLSSLENMVLESRLLVDNLERGEEGAAILICSNRYTKAVWQADVLKSIYPQYFSG